MKRYVRAAIRSANDEYAGEASKIASYATDPRVLSQFASEDRITVCKNLIQNPHTPESVLFNLVAQDREDINSAFADYSNTSTRVLKKLVQNSSLTRKTIIRITEHPNVNKSVIYELITNQSWRPDFMYDVIPWVIKDASKSTKTPVSVLRCLCEKYAGCSSIRDLAYDNLKSRGAEL